MHRPAAGGQTVLALFDWSPDPATADAGFVPDDVEATLDLPALASRAGDVMALQVLWESAATEGAMVLEAFPSMEIPGYVQP